MSPLSPASMAGWIINQKVRKMAQDKQMTVAECLNSPRKTANIILEATIVSKDGPKSFQKKDGQEGYIVILQLQDHTGTIKSTLFDPQSIPNIGDRIRIEKGWINEFKGQKEIQLSQWGGKFTILQSGAQQGFQQQPPQYQQPQQFQQPPQYQQPQQQPQYSQIQQPQVQAQQPPQAQTPQFNQMGQVQPQQQPQQLQQQPQQLQQQPQGGVDFKKLLGQEGLDSTPESSPPGDGSMLIVEAVKTLSNSFFEILQEISNSLKGIEAELVSTGLEVVSKFDQVFSRIVRESNAPPSEIMEKLSIVMKDGDENGIEDHTTAIYWVASEYDIDISDIAGSK